MPENHLTTAWISYGLSPITSRAALRDMVTGLLLDGPGASLGVHGLGVFYVLTQKERFVIRDGVVFRVPERDVIKLRPAKGDADELDESPDVRIAFQYAVSSEGEYAFESTSRTGQFVATSPVNIVDDVWRLVYAKIDGIPGYGFGDNSLTDEEIAAVPNWTAGDPQDVLAVRLEHSLLNIVPTLEPGLSSFGHLVISAECDDATLAQLDDVSYGREVSAHFRSRSLTV